MHGSSAAARRGTWWILGGLIALASLVAARNADAVAPTPPPASKTLKTPHPVVPAIDPTRVIVRFRQGAGAAAASNASGATYDGSIRGTSFSVVSTNGQTVRSLLASLRQDSRVVSAQPDYIRHAFDTPDDPQFASQMYLSTVRVPDAWDTTHGAGQTIAVVDTGVEAHEDIVDKLLTGYDFVNGHVQQVDGVGHGTTVASVAAAATNNGIGIAGVAWDAKILPVRVLGPLGTGDDITVAEGITWATDHGATVINLSLGGPGESDVLREAVDYALSRNVIVVAARGNDSSVAPDYPAAIPGVVAVAATDASGVFADYSSFGDVTLAAPGCVLGAQPSNYYGFACGTSFAAPIVSGIAALVRAAHPTWSEQQVVSDLVTSARDEGPPGDDAYYGAGLVDAAAALGAPKQSAEIPPHDTFEPDDSLSTAATLTHSLRATISPEGDADWYAYDVAQPGLFAANVTPVESITNRAVLDLTLQAYDAAGKLLVSRDQAWSGYREGLVVPLSKAGRIYLRVAAATGARGDVPYDLVATRIPFYTPQALPLPDRNDTDYFGVAGIDNAGDVFGHWITIGGTRDTGIIWRGGVAQDYAVGDPVAINDNGDIIGNNFTPGPAASPCGLVGQCAFLDRRGAVTYLNPINVATGFNSSDDVIGGTSDGNGGIWHAGAVTNVPIGFGAIDESGRIVGSIATDSTYDVAAWQQGVTSDLGRLGCFSAAIATNRRGDLAGEWRPVDADSSCDFRSYPMLRSQDGVFTDLGWTPGAYLGGIASAVNDAGAVVGDSYVDASTVGFLWSNGVMINLNDLFPAGDGWFFAHASGLNQAGQIAGVGSYDGTAVPYILSPSNVPAGPPPGPPRNDDFGQATTIPCCSALGDFHAQTVSTANATREAGEPTILDRAGGHSVWYSWHAKYSGSVELRTDGSTFDTLVAVYTGSTLEELTRVAQADDSEPGGASTLTFDAVAGTTYSFQVDTAGTTGGSLILTLQFIPDGSPNNDAFTAAVVVPPAGDQLPFCTTVQASKEAGEPNHAGNVGGHSIWYVWTPNKTGEATVPVFASSPDWPTMVAVYTGSDVGHLTAVAANAGRSTSDFDSAVMFHAVAGQTYRIAVDGRDGAVGTCSVGFSVDSDLSTTPNDSWGHGLLLVGATGQTVSGSNVGATKEPGEPNHAGNPGGASVWFRFSAQRSGVVTFTTSGSSFDTLLAAYPEGGSLSTIRPLAANDNASADVTSSTISVPVRAFSAIVLALDGASRGGAAAATGTYKLSWTFTDSATTAPSASAPANDAFTGAQGIDGSSGTTTGTTADASLEYGEPTILDNPGGHSVWFKWTASAFGPVSFDTSGTSFASDVAVYTGPFLQKLTKVGEAPGRVTISAIPGLTYLIQLDGLEATDAGPYVLRWLDSAGPSPAPDTTITSGPSNTVTDTNASFAFDSSMPNATFECSLDGGAWTSCLSGQRYSGLAPGQHTFGVRSSLAGQTDPTPATDTWRITTAASSPATDYPSTVLSDRPLGYWRLDDTGAVATDASTGHDDGAFEGATTHSVPGATGDGDAATAFAGGDVRIPGSFGLNGSFSIEFWAKPNGAISGYPSLINRGPSWTADGYLVFATPDGALWFKRDNTEIGTPPGVFTPTAFHHYAVVYDGSTLHWYVDGRQLVARAVTWPQAGGTAPLLLAAGDQSANATLDDVAVYPSALSADRVAAHVSAASAQAQTIETVISDGPAGTVSDPNAEFAFISPMTGVDFQCNLDGGSWTACSSPATYSGLPVGSHSFRVRAVDGAGHFDQTPAERDWTVAAQQSPSESPYVSSVLADKPTDYWRLDDDGPVATNTVATVDDGTYEGAVSLMQPGATADGDTAVAFAGGDVRIAGNATFELNGAFSIEFWAHANGTITGYPSLLDHGASWTSDGYLVFAAPNGALWFKRDNVEAGTPAGVLTGGFHAYAITYDGSVLRWYVDGSPVSSKTVSYPAASATASLFFAAGDQQANVTLDDVALYGTTLTTGRIAAHVAAAGSAGTSTLDTSITEGPSGTVTSTNASFAFDGTGGGFECRLDGGSWTRCTSPTDYAQLSAGSHTFDVRAVDGSGNADQTPASRTWTIAPPSGDVTPPETSIDDGPVGTITTTSATFAFSASEAATFTCALDGAAWSGCASPSTQSSLQPGEHTFLVRATDGAGNVDPTPASRTFEVEPAGANLLPNGAFRDGSGWSSWQGSAAFSNGVATVTVGTGNVDFSLFTSPRPIHETSAGVSYTGSISVRSDTPGHRVCLGVREWTAAGGNAGEQYTCTVDTTSWQTLTASLTTSGAGDTVELYVLETGAAAADSFQVQNASLTR